MTTLASLATLPAGQSVIQAGLVNLATLPVGALVVPLGDGTVLMGLADSADLERAQNLLGSGDGTTLPPLWRPDPAGVAARVAPTDLLARESQLRHGSSELAVTLSVSPKETPEEGEIRSTLRPRPPSSPAGNNIQAVREVLENPVERFVALPFLLAISTLEKAAVVLEEAGIVSKILFVPLLLVGGSLAALTGVAEIAALALPALAVLGVTRAYWKVSALIRPPEMDRLHSRVIRGKEPLDIDHLTPRDLYYLAGRHRTYAVELLMKAKFLETLFGRIGIRFLRQRIVNSIALFDVIASLAQGLDAQTSGLTPWEMRMLDPGTIAELQRRLMALARGK